MITYLKIIKKQLLNRLAFRKYLLYAIGEIFLVVVGILIALQINNWNENRKNKQAEELYLTGVIEELQNNDRLITRLVLDRFEKKMKGLEMAKNYAKGLYAPSDTLEFLNDVSYGAVFSNGLEFLTSSVFDELVNTGNLQLISNDSLKTEINKYYAFSVHC